MQFYPRNVIYRLVENCGTSHETRVRKQRKTISAFTECNAQGWMQMPSLSLHSEEKKINSVLRRRAEITILRVFR